MNNKKKSGTGLGEPEQLGPYQLKEQVPQDEHGEGELYRATHETSGATALVFKPATSDGSPPLTDWEVHCVSSQSSNSIAMEVKHSAWSVAPDRHSVEALECTFGDVHDGVRRMARAFSISNEPRIRWRPGLALAGAVAMYALTFTLVRLAPVSQPPYGPNAPVAGAVPEPMSHEVPTNTAIPPMDGWLFLDSPDGGPSVLAARPLPSKPFKGQRRPPCKPRVEVELNGGCWVPHELKAPCPEDLYEYQGKCYLVSGQVQPPPQSLGQ